MVESVMLVTWLALLYMLPTIIAAVHQRTNTGAIAALNVLLGWTFIGWVVALVWAMTKGKA